MGEPPHGTQTVLSKGEEIPWDLDCPLQSGREAPRESQTDPLKRCQRQQLLQTLRQKQN